MSLAEKYRHLYDYERNCNAKSLAMLESVPVERRGDPDYSKAIGRMSHLIAARKRWLHRLGILAEMPSLFPETTIEKLPAQVAEVESLWTNYLGKLDEAELNRVIEAMIANGSRYRWTVEQVLTQLFGHAFYHRGQIAQLVGNLGGKPVDTDYIFWCSPPLPADVTG